MTETATVVDWPKSRDHGTTLWTTAGTAVQHPYTLTNGVLRNRMGQELREAHDKNQWVECTLAVPEVEIKEGAVLARPKVVAAEWFYSDSESDFLFPDEHRKSVVSPADLEVVPDPRNDPKLVDLITEAK